MDGANVTSTVLPARILCRSSTLCLPRPPAENVTLEKTDRPGSVAAGSVSCPFPIRAAT